MELYTRIYHMLAIIRNPAGMEPCCFCRKVTVYWYVARKVAVCPQCAKVANPLKVPSHKAWLNRERTAEKAIKESNKYNFAAESNHD